MFWYYGVQIGRLKSLKSDATHDTILLVDKNRLTKIASIRGRPANLNVKNSSNYEIVLKPSRIDGALSEAKILEQLPNQNPKRR